jgi:hypothetical protein
VDTGQVLFVTGKGKYHRTIDVRERCAVIGLMKAKALIAVHNFSGSDWGGKFACISKKRWIESFLSLSDDDPIVKVFQTFGSSAHCHDDIELIEKCVCCTYMPNSNHITIPELRWHMFKKQNFDCEKLPPTVDALKPHIQRANYISMVYKSYKDVFPTLPPITDNGWSKTDGTYIPVTCLEMPAPIAVLELVKCGCKGSCHNCACKRNDLVCTDLCKCTDCDNIPDYKITTDDDL